MLYVVITVLSSAAETLIMHISTSIRRKPTMGERVEKLNQKYEKTKLRHEAVVDIIQRKLGPLTQNPILKNTGAVTALLESVKLSLDEVDGIISVDGLYSNCSAEDLEGTLDSIAEDLEDLAANTVHRTTAARIEFGDLLDDPDSLKILCREGDDDEDDGTPKKGSIKVTIQGPPSFKMRPRGQVSKILGMGDSLQD